MPKVITWDENTAAIELRKRYKHAKDARSRTERIWEISERSAYLTSSAQVARVNYSLQGGAESGLEDIDNSTANVDVSYAFKNLRFIHAQLSANPPSVVTRPASNDPEDRRKADAADRLVRHAIRAYNMQELVDKASLNTLLYGTSFMKTRWNPDAGDIISHDEETGEMEMEGKIEFSIPSTWNVIIDPDAETWEDVRYVMERILLPYEEAIFRWPDKKDILERARLRTANDSDAQYAEIGLTSSISAPKYEVVELYEYWERGLAVNGFMGRFMIHSQQGELVTSVMPNPHRFKPAAQKKTKARVAELPYHMFTDIDVPQQLWGKSVMEYVAPLQDTLNRLDSSVLDNIQAHGICRLVLPESAEISDKSITNSTWDYVKYTGNIPPSFMEVPTLMPQVDTLRAQVKQGIDDMWGINESMFGQQSREQSGFSMQYATNQGNMIRRRMFNKYVLFVESIYKSYLKLVREHWTIKRKIEVLGKEKALVTTEIKGADIDGGFDLVVEYGTSLSLDPLTRKEEVLALQPLFEKAGVPARVALKMLKLGELGSLYDMMELAEDRQREVFEEMIATGRYIPPEELQDHENMLAYAMQYVMTVEFKYLEADLKILIVQHIKDRAALAAQEKTPMGVAEGMMPGGPGVPGPPPAPGPLPTEASPVGGAVAKPPILPE